METKLSAGKLTIVCSTKGKEEMLCIIRREDKPLAYFDIDPYGGTLTLVTKESEVKVGMFKERFTGRPIEVELEW